MLKKLKYVAASAAFLLTATLTGIQVSAEGQLYSETGILLQDGGFYETSYEVEGPRYDAATAASFEEALVNACRNFEDTLDVSEYNIPVADFKALYFGTINDNPDLFYVKNYYSYYQADGCVTSVIIYYDYTKEEAAPMIEELNAAVDKVMAGVDENWSDVEKALYFHEYLTTNCAYTYTYYNMYELLVNGRGVCQAYALTNKYLLTKAGIPSKTVSSEALNHAWNLLKIDGKWYYTDVTWDDPYPDILGYSGHKNFLRSKDGIIATNHTSTDWTYKGENVYDTVTDTKYDSYFWADSEAPFCPYGSRWFYTTDDGVCYYDFEEGASTMFYGYNHKNKWYVKGYTNRYWLGVFTGTGIYDRRFVYNGPKALYSIDLTGMYLEGYTPVAEVEYAIDSSSEDYIYGFGCNADGLVTMLLKDDWYDETPVYEELQLGEKNEFYDLSSDPYAEEGAQQIVYMLAKDLSKCRIKLGENGTVYSYADKVNNVMVTIPDVAETTELEWYYSIDSGATWVASDEYIWVLSDYESTLSVSKTTAEPGETIRALLWYENWIGKDNSGESYRFFVIKAEDLNTEDIRRTDESKIIWYSGDIEYASTDITLPEEEGEYAIMALATTTSREQTIFMYPEYVIVNVESAFEITTQPVDYTGRIGDTAKFTVEAEGAKAYQWYQNTGSGWVAINTSAGRSKSISIPVVAFRVGFQYKCVVSDGTNTITSNVVSIKLDETLAITTQPVDYIGAIGDTAKFTVDATGATSYQWYQNTGSGWVAINTAAGRSNTISIAVAQFRVGFQYKCVVSDGTNTLTSNVVSIKLDEVLAIATQPVDYIGNIGDTAKFTVEATGATSYQWYQNTGSGWVAMNTSAGRSKSISIPVVQFRVGFKYYCAVSDGTSTINTNEVTIKLDEVLAITSQPVDYVGEIGETAKFTVAATGATSYQWYQNTGSGWVAINTSAGRSNTLSIPVVAFRVGFQYRCEVSDGTSTITSEVAELLI